MPAVDDVSVIICTYTEARWNDLLEAIESLYHQTLQPAEIIISVDHSPSLLQRVQTQFPGLIVVQNNGTRGLSETRNSGIAVAHGRKIVFLDDDAIAEPDWLANLTQWCDRPGILGVGGRTEAIWQNEQPAWFPKEFGWVVGCEYREGTPSGTRIRNPFGGNMCIRRDVFEHFGFRSNIGRIGTIPMGCEETELCIRAHQHWPQDIFVYEPRAVIRHKVPANRSQLKYFRSRCYAEGLSKAFISRIVGVESGLASERAYTFQTLPRGILKGLHDAIFHHDINGFARAGAIVLGLVVTTIGFIVGSISIQFSRPRQHYQSKECLKQKQMSIQTPRQAYNNSIEHPVSNATRDLRVLMVTPRYFPFVGGVESHVSQVAHRLAKHIDVTVLTTDPTGKLAANEIRDGVKLQRVRAMPANRDYYFAPDIYHIIRHGNWDIIHIQSYHTFVAPIGMLAAQRANIPYVVTFHGGGHSSRLRNRLRGAQMAMLRPLLARAEKLIAVAKFEIGFYGRQLKLPGEKFVFIPNGCDLPSVEPGMLPTKQSGTLIASVGRLERYKGHQHAIAALPHILKQCPDARLWIAGVGPYGTELEHLAAKVGLADRVEIKAIPASQRDVMATELAQASLFVLFSEYETQPIAALEALAIGCPVLVADTSGLHELAENGWARAIPINSTPEQFATAMLEQIRQPRTRITLNLPTWDDCATSLLALYQSVVKEKPCAS